MSEATRDENEERAAARIEDLEPEKDAKGGCKSAAKPPAKTNRPIASFGESTGESPNNL